MYITLLKPIIDFVVAMIAVVVISPIFIIVFVILTCVNKGTPFFTQPRPGKREKIFRVIKFKTMNDRLDSDGKLLPDDKRLTSIGKFIRKTSLDEIPQLINVIKGDMSLVGPRPLLQEYLPLYNEVQRKRHAVRPGITGWAQVNGRNTIGWKKKFELDVYYVDNRSLGLDLLILYKTVYKVFASHGISAPGVVTMDKFKGE